MAARESATRAVASGVSGTSSMRMPGGSRERRLLNADVIGAVPHPTIVPHDGDSRPCRRGGSARPAERRLHARRGHREPEEPGPVASKTALAIAAPMGTMAGSPPPCGVRASFFTRTVSIFGSHEKRGIS